jgi:hypothetical protein
VGINEMTAIQEDVIIRLTIRRSPPIPQAFRRPLIITSSTATRCRASPRVRPTPSATIEACDLNSSAAMKNTSVNSFSVVDVDPQGRRSTDSNCVGKFA